MKRYIVLLLGIALWTQLSAGEVFRLDTGWKFYSRGDAVSDNTLSVNLPHTWNGDGAGPNREYFRGPGVYLRDVEIPTAWIGKRIFLRFNAANTALTVMVNGRLAGDHLGGYTACTFEITKLVQPGAKASLWAQVNNAPRTDVLPTAGDANSYGGLLRGVELIVTPALAIAPTDHSSSGVYVTSHKNGNDDFSGEATVKLISLLDNKTAQVAVTVTDGMGQAAGKGDGRVKVSDKGIVSVSVPFTVESPRLWDGVNDPYMYDVKVRVTVDGAAVDSAVVRTGFRDYGFDPARGFVLNGQPYPLRGVSVTQDREGIGNALQPYQIEEDVALVREMGANFVCVSGAPHAQEFYDACDRAGIVVWSELPFTGEAYLSDRAFYNTSAFKANGKQQLTEIIRQQMNHPSIVMWGIFNGLGQRGDDPVPYVKELNALAKKEDPSRYTVCTSNQDGDLNFITDLVLWQHRFGWKEGQPGDLTTWLDYLHRSWGKLSSAVSYGAGGSIYDQCDSLSRPDIAGAHPERWQTHVHEQSWSCVKNDRQLWAVVIDNLFDYGASGRNRGRGPGVNDFGLVSFDRKYCKDAFYFYKANWNTADEFVYLAERRWDVRPGTVHTLRVFSNCPEVELFVNGVSLGIKQGTDGVFSWPGVALLRGDNEVEARFGTITDRMRIVAGQRLL